MIFNLANMSFPFPYPFDEEMSKMMQLEIFKLLAEVLLLKLHVMFKVIL